MKAIDKSLDGNVLRTMKAAFVLLVLALTMALAPGCGTDPVEFEPLDTARGPVLAGRVTADGGPLAAVTVRLESVTAGLPASLAAELESLRPDAGTSMTAGADGLAAKSGGGQSASIRFAATDADGRYMFADVAPGQYLLTASGRNHLAGSAPTAIFDPGFSSASAETTYVDIALVPTGTIGGRALLATESLHAGTVVYVEGTSVVAITRNDGEYVLRDVPVGLRDVKAMRDGYRAAATTAMLTAAGDSVHAADLVLGIDSNLPPVVTILGPAITDVYSTIELNAVASDPDGTIVRYQWDFEDDGIFDTSSTTTAYVSHWYQNEGVHRPKLRVTDDRGGVTYAVIRIDAVEAVYVAASGTDANPGTRTAPVATLDRAYQVAANLSESIGLRLAAGTYAPPQALLNHPLTGGFDPATWTRTAGSRSVLNLGGATLIVSGLSELGFTGIEVRATAPGADGNSIAMLVTASSDLYFGDCRFVAAAALPGAAGASGEAGVAIPGQVGTTYSSAGCPGGNCILEGGSTLLPNVGWGGRGGSQLYTPAPGTNGTGGAAGGVAGAQNTSTVPPTDGQNGGNAAPGSAASGVHGTVASWTGSFSGVVWQAGHGNDGGHGQTSVGGGGGGGGGGATLGIYDYAYYGGGGGAGGASTGGMGGLGGRAGGSSFAVVTVLAENSYVSFTECEFVSGSAGNGGGGGGGGMSAPAASGGAGGGGRASPTQGWIGGDGGNGGSSAASGSGGGGGGGAGGLSYAVYVTGYAEPTFTASTFQFGTAGSGGLGGLRGGTASRAPNGLDGSAGALYDNVQ